MARGQALMGLDALAKYLQGQLKGDIADLAHQLGTQLRDKQSAFEGEVLRHLKAIELNTQLNGEALRRQGQHIANIEARCRGPHLPPEDAPILSLVPPTEAI
jgi:hypothetical protein